MTTLFTGDDQVLSCEAIQKLERRQDVCGAQFSGIYCLNNECVDLTGCRVKGAQSCGFFSRCTRNNHLSVDTNSFEQLVTSCEVDALFIIWFIMAIIILGLFLWSGIEVVSRSRAEMKGSTMVLIPLE